MWFIVFILWTVRLVYSTRSLPNVGSSSRSQFLRLCILRSQSDSRRRRLYFLAKPRASRSAECARLPALHRYLSWYALPLISRLSTLSAAHQSHDWCVCGSALGSSRVESSRVALRQSALLRRTRFFMTWATLRRLKLARPARAPAHCFCSPARLSHFSAHSLSDTASYEHRTATRLVHAAVAKSQRTPLALLYLRLITASATALCLCFALLVYLLHAVKVTNDHWPPGWTHLYSYCTCISFFILILRYSYSYTAGQHLPAVIGSGFSFYLLLS